MQASHWTEHAVTAPPSAHNPCSLLSLSDTSITVCSVCTPAFPAASGFSKEEVEGWESLVWHSKSLQRGVEDLGAAMYPPQVRRCGV